MEKKSERDTPEAAHKRGLEQLEAGHKRKVAPERAPVIENHEPHAGFEPGETAADAHRNGPLPNTKK